jgi:hypothetical protein
VPLKDTIRSFKEILTGHHDSLPESAFYMVRISITFKVLVMNLMLTLLSYPFLNHRLVLLRTSRPRLNNSQRKWVARNYARTPNFRWHAIDLCSLENLQMYGSRYACLSSWNLRTLFKP